MASTTYSTPLAMTVINASSGRDAKGGDRNIVAFTEILEANFLHMQSFILCLLFD